MADSGAILTPPTLSAIAGKVQTELQDLISSWNGYTGMNTAFTRSSNAYYSTDSGEPLQPEWKLRIPDTVLLPIKALEENGQIYMEYRIIGGIVHRGQDNEGHIQAVCRNHLGWLVFDDMKEPTQHDSNPPFADDWVCIWLLQFSWVIPRLPTYWLQGLDSLATRTAVEFSRRVWRLEHYPQDLINHMKSHCLMCGCMVLCHQI